jgi:hypothetical protein
MTEHYAVYNEKTGKPVKDFYGPEACWLAQAYAAELNEEAGRDDYEFLNIGYGEPAD